MKRLISIGTKCSLSCAALLALGTLGCGGTPQGGSAPVANVAPAGNTAMPQPGVPAADGAHTAMDPMGNVAGGAASSPAAHGETLTPEQQMAASMAAAGTATTTPPATAHAPMTTESGAAAGATPATPPAAAHADAAGGAGPVPGTPAVAGNAPAAANAPDNPAAANPANPAAANAGAAVAAAPGEAAAGGEGKNGQSEITGAVGSIEYVIQSLIAMAKSGNYDGVDNIISEKAKGLAANVREGNLPSTQIEAFKTKFDKLTPLSRKNVGSGLQYNFKQGTTLISITVSKENGTFRVKELTIRDGAVK